MTTFLSRLELESLMISSEGAHVSLFMPTYRVGRETRQNRIRLKNLIRDAERQLIELGYRVPDAQALLQLAEDLLGPTGFWMDSGDGLALFLSADTTRRYSLPIRLRKKLVVTDRFHVKPLLPLFSSDGSFFVIALSQNEVRLLQGTRNVVTQVELENTNSLARMLKPEDPETHLNWYCLQECRARLAGMPRSFTALGAERHPTPFRGRMTLRKHIFGSSSDVGKSR